MRFVVIMLPESYLSGSNNRTTGAKVVAVIPAYNEERSIAGVVLLAQRCVDRVVVCDDGSSDLTGAIAEGLGALVVRHPFNRGKGEALRSAFEAVVKFDPDVVVTLDGDGQHDPGQIPRLVEPILAGKCDVVVGSRYLAGSRSDIPFCRGLGLRVVNFLCRKAVNASVRDTQSGFRAYSQKAFRVVALCEEKGYGVDGEQLALAVKNGLHVVEVPVDTRYKGLGKTSKKVPLLHGQELIASILRLVTEGRPLLYVGLPGALLTSVGLGLTVYLFWSFNVTKFFDLQLAVITFGMSFVGLLLMMTAVMLHGITKIVHLVNKRDIPTQNQTQ